MNVVEKFVPMGIFFIVVLFTQTVLRGFLVGKGLSPNKETGIVELSIVFAFMAGVVAGWVASKTLPRKKDET